MQLNLSDQFVAADMEGVVIRALDLAHKTSSCRSFLDVNIKGHGSKASCEGKYELCPVDGDVSLYQDKHEEKCAIRDQLCRGKQILDRNSRWLFPIEEESCKVVDSHSREENTRSSTSSVEKEWELFLAGVVGL